MSGGHGHDDHGHGGGNKGGGINIGISSMIGSFFGLASGAEPVKDALKGGGGGGGHHH